MDSNELYFWDLNGYLVIEGVLTPDEVAAANEAIDHYSQQIEIAAAGDGAKGSERLAGTGRPTLEGMLQMEKPYCDPFRNILAHPAMVKRMNEMSGPGFRLDHGPLLIAGSKGTEGLTMHGSGDPFKSYVAYHHQNGKSYCGGVTVTWQLADVYAGDGGFACVPGSHKSKFPMPECEWRRDNVPAGCRRPAIMSVVAVSSQ